MSFIWWPRSTSASASETKGRCWREVYERRGEPCELLIADALDRLAADVAEIKAKVDAVSPGDVRHFVESEKAWVTLVAEQRDEATRQRDDARAEVERLQEEVDDREQTEQVKRLREENERQHRASLNYIRDRDQYRRERDEARAEVERLKADDKQAPDDLGVLQDARGLSERCKELASRIAMQKIESQAEKLLAESSQQQPSAAPQPDGTGYTPNQSDWLIAGAIDRLAAELAARQAANHPGTLDSSPAAPQPAAVRDTQAAMDKDRAVVRRYCAAEQPAAPPPWWLTEEERRVLQNHAESLREQRFALERGGQAIGYSVNPGLLKREADLIDAILSRAGSPPVVEVPAISRRDVPMQNEAFAYRDAMDKAGVKWKEKEVGRE